MQMPFRTLVHTLTILWATTATVNSQSIPVNAIVPESTLLHEGRPVSQPTATAVEQRTPETYHEQVVAQLLKNKNKKSAPVPNIASAKVKELTAKQEDILSLGKHTEAEAKIEKEALHKKEERLKQANPDYVDPGVTFDPLDDAHIDDAARLAGIPEFKVTLPIVSLPKVPKAPKAPKAPNCGGCTCKACCGTGRCTCEAPGSEAFKTTRCGAHLALQKAVSTQQKAETKHTAAKDAVDDAKHNVQQHKQKVEQAKSDSKDDASPQAKAMVARQMEDQKKAISDFTRKVAAQKVAAAAQAVAKKTLAKQKKAVKADNKLQHKRIEKTQKLAVQQKTEKKEKEEAEKKEKEEEKKEKEEAEKKEKEEKEEAEKKEKEEKEKAAKEKAAKEEAEHKNCGGCTCKACCGTGRCTCEAPGSEAFKTTRCGAHLALQKAVSTQQKAETKHTAAKDAVDDAKDNVQQHKQKVEQAKSDSKDDASPQAKAMVARQMEDQKKAISDFTRKVAAQKVAAAAQAVAKKTLAKQKKAVKAANELQDKTIAKAKLEKKRKKQISKQMQDRNMAIEEHKKQVEAKDQMMQKTGKVNPAVESEKQKILKEMKTAQKANPKLAEKKEEHDQTQEAKKLEKAKEASAGAKKAAAAAAAAQTNKAAAVAAAAAVKKAAAKKNKEAKEEGKKEEVKEKKEEEKKEDEEQKEKDEQQGETPIMAMVIPAGLRQLLSFIGMFIIIWGGWYAHRSWDERLAAAFTKAAQYKDVEEPEEYVETHEEVKKTNWSLYQSCCAAKKAPPPKRKLNKKPKSLDVSSVNIPGVDLADAVPCAWALITGWLIFSSSYCFSDNADFFSDTGGAVLDLSQPNIPSAVLCLALGIILTVPQAAAIKNRNAKMKSGLGYASGLCWLLLATFTSFNQKWELRNQGVPLGFCLTGVISITLSGKVLWVARKMGHSWEQTGLPNRDFVVFNLGGAMLVFGSFLFYLGQSQMDRPGDSWEVLRSGDCWHYTDSDICGLPIFIGTRSLLAFIAAIALVLVSRRIDFYRDRGVARTFTWSLLYLLFWCLFGVAGLFDLQGSIYLDSIKDPRALVVLIMSVLQGLSSQALRRSKMIIFVLLLEWAICVNMGFTSDYSGLSAGGWGMGLGIFAAFLMSLGTLAAQRDGRMKADDVENDAPVVFSFAYPLLTAGYLALAWAFTLDY